MTFTESLIECGAGMGCNGVGWDEVKWNRMGCNGMRWDGK